jgi:hypothetical protein
VRDAGGKRRTVGLREVVCGQSAQQGYMEPAAAPPWAPRVAFEHREGQLQPLAFVPRPTNPRLRVRPGACPSVAGRQHGTASPR